MGHKIRKPFINYFLWKNEWAQETVAVTKSLRCDDIPQSPFLPSEFSQ